MSEQFVFEYESDWVEYFNSVLKNEIREEIGNKNSIKASIIESNQSLEEFLKKHPEIKRIPSKESFFHNLRIKNNENDFYFYLNNQNERFWVIHNIENQKKIENIVKNLTTNTYLQDKIYLSQKTMETHKKNYSADSLGLTLNFEQKFTLNKNNPVFINGIEEFDDIAFTLQIWPKRSESINYFLDKFREIKCPINYKSLNFVFNDKDTDNILIKEDLYYDGSFTIHRGKDLHQHLKFLHDIKQQYNKSMDEIEEKRIDWDLMKGDLFTIELDKEINPKNFIQAINQTKEFKINGFYMCIKITIFILFVVLIFILEENSIFKSHVQRYMSI
ncbi:MAG: hypothetical protein K9W44_00665 [Candidatus Lokiarchaeota archaeon]|nr:hypothetical protein [Candidatus Harpocratesius repetitus]